jgi:hypothetical protein
MWGPQAGYFARRAPRAIVLLPLRGENGDSFEFDISMGVRSDDRQLARDIDAVLIALQPRIDRILDEFGVVRPAAK